jgi:hypothetical protein
MWAYGVHLLHYPLLHGGVNLLKHPRPPHLRGLPKHTESSTVTHLTRIRHAARKAEEGDLDGGEGALAAAVAEDAVEVEGEQVAAHRGARGSSPRPCSLPLRSSGRRDGPNDEVGADPPYRQGGADA